MRRIMKRPATGWAVTLLAGWSLTLAVAAPASDGGSDCIAPMTYIPLDARQVGAGNQGAPALGTYERISPDGRFVLRSFSGARLGKVSLMELPAFDAAVVKIYLTPFSNEAFPVQGTWRYLVDVNGEHYRFADVLARQREARPLFRGGMIGFYAAASELADASPENSAPGTFHLRSLSWPQDANPDNQGVGPLQLETLQVRDDGQTARITDSTGARFVCGGRVAEDGDVYALPMISVDGLEFSAIPQRPATGAPTMRVYSLSASAMAREHPCELRADLGFSPGKAVFGFPTPAGGGALLTYSDVGYVYVFDRTLNQSFRLDHGKYRVLASAFPGLTRDGRVVYGASWRDCPQAGNCPEQAGYVVIDPYQSAAYRDHWRAQGQPAPKACITRREVLAERERFARFHKLPP